MFFHGIRFFVSSLVFLFLANDASAAAANCERRSNSFENVIFLKTADDCELFSKLEQEVMAVQRFAVATPKLTLVIREENTNASFDNGRLIWLPKKLILTQEGKQSVARYDQLKVAFIHEYGHALLHERFKAELGIEFGSLLVQLDDLSLLAVSNLLLDERSMALRRMGATIASSQDFAIYAKVITGLTELYADVVSVLAFSDGEAMSGAITPEHAKNQEFLPKNIRLRSFSHQHNIKDIDENRDPHTQYSLVRSFLGPLLMQLQTDDEKRQFLLKLEKVIIEAVKQQYLLAENNEDLWTTKEANAWVIQKFQE